MSGSSYSISRIPVDLVINEVNIIHAEIVRHLSPLTIRKLINSIPVSGILHRFGDSFIYIQTDIKTGPEKPVNQFKMGDIAFSPQSGIFCVFLRDSTIAQNFNLIGRIISSKLDVFSSIKTGDQMAVRR